MVTSVKATTYGQLIITTPYPHTLYIEHLVRKNCWTELWDLFKVAGRPLKEMSESYAAYKHLKRFKKVDDVTVVNIGDGAHCFTSAMFAFLTKHHCVSIDPVINMGHVRDWGIKHKVERISCFKRRWQNFDWEVCLPTNKILLTFVHAHVDPMAVIQSIPPHIEIMGAYINGCCQRQLQFLPTKSSLWEGLSDIKTDWGILSPHRDYQVWLPSRSEE